MKRRPEFSFTIQPRIQDQAVFADTQPFYTPDETCEIDKIGEDESQAILDLTEIHGDPVNKNINESSSLTVGILKQAGLEPKYLAKIGEAKIAFSKKYDGVNRTAVVAYVENGDRYVARTFYLSNSHGIWKFLPNYSAFYDETDVYGMHYGKGFSENSIDLPLVAQDKIFEFDDNNPISVDPVKSSVIFLGTSRQNTADIKDTYHFSTISKPVRLSGNFYPEYDRKNPFKKVPPEELEFEDKNQEPNFRDKRKSWSAQTKLYGNVEFDLYGSYDRKILYLFCRDDKNRAWISGIENGSPIQETGVRMQWVHGGDLLTPAYEYDKQTGGYGDLRISPVDQSLYVDMFNNYLSKVPVIQAYLNSLKK